jgi:hypothetical protein
MLAYGYASEGEEMMVVMLHRDFQEFGEPLRSVDPVGEPTAYLTYPMSPDSRSVLM